MLDSTGFDLWANNYDINVNIIEKNDSYPFAGYRKILNKIYNEIREKKAKKILDIGFGTAFLTEKLYNDNIEIYGIDFSKKMVEIAKEKMPLANLVEYDFSKGYPEIFKNEKFDFIIFTYSIHHLTTSQKVSFINDLKNYLEKDGKILIANVAFEKIVELEKCKNDNIDLWDNDEIYMVYEELKDKIKDLKFDKITFCSGIFSISK